MRAKVITPPDLNGDLAGSKSQYEHLAGVDVFKYILAFCVVAIHFRPNFNREWLYPSMFEWFIRLAVPFYFITSGFLLQRKLSAITEIREKRKLLLMRAFKLFRLWICWLIIYLPLSLSFMQSGTFASISRAYICEVILHGWAPKAAPLWFLYSMIWICLIMAVTVGLKHFKSYLFGFFLLLSLTYYAGSYFDIPVVATLKNYTENILGGGIYMTAGMLVFGKKWQNVWPFVWLCLGLSVAFFFLRFPLTPLLGGVGLFLLALKLPVQSGSRILSLRSQSMWIYYCHMYILIWVLITPGAREYISNPWLLLVIVWSLCAILARALNFLQTRPRFRFLNFLVS